MKHAVGLALLALSCACPAALPCAEDVRAQALQTFQALENNSQNDRAIFQIYSSEFTSSFKAQYPFQSFYGSLLGVQNRLGIGAGHGRSLESRVLGAASAEPLNPAAVSLQHGSRGSASSHEAAFQVQFVTSSGYGKVVQRAVVQCEGGAWRLSGIWYVPL